MIFFSCKNNNSKTLNTEEDIPIVINKNKKIYNNEDIKNIKKEISKQNIDDIDKIKNNTKKKNNQKEIDDIENNIQKIQEKQRDGKENYLKKIDNEGEKNDIEDKNNNIKKKKSKIDIDDINQSDKKFIINDMDEYKSVNIKKIKNQKLEEINNNFEKIGKKVDSLHFSNDKNEIKDTKLGDFFAKISSNIKYEINSLKANNILRDFCNFGVIAIIKKDLSNDVVDESVFPILEWQCKLSDGVKLVICNDLVSDISIGFGLKFIFICVGYGDGFFKAYLNKKIINRSLKIFKIKSLFSKSELFNNYKNFNLGFFISYLEKLFLSIVVNKDDGYSLGINCHFILNNFYLSLLVNLFNFKIFLDILMFYDCFLLSLNYNKETYNLFSYIKLLNLIFFLSDLTNIMKLLNKYFVILLNCIASFKTKLEYSFSISLLINFASCQFIISYNTKSIFEIGLMLNFIEKSSIIGWLKNNERELKSISI